MNPRHAATLVVFAALALAAPRAHADADPALGYAYTTYSLPYHALWSYGRPNLTSGDFVSTGPKFDKRNVATGSSAWGLDAVGLGVGIGYDGWNAQLDILHASDISAGALTFGYRLNFQFGNVEVWARLAAGPAMAVNYSDLGASSRSGGILTMAQVGLDYFFWKETMCFGVSGTAAPGYTFPLTFSADFDIKAGFRLII